MGTLNLQKKSVSVSHIYIGLNFDRYCACITNKGTIWAHKIKKINKFQSAIFTLGYILTDIVLVSPKKKKSERVDYGHTKKKVQSAIFTVG